MAVKVIETQARITAKDETGGTFNMVAQKMRNLEQAALAVNRRMDSVARGMSSTQWRRQAEFQAGIVNRMSQMTPVVARGATITRGMGSRLSAARTAIGDFASYAAPGAIGGALGLGGAAVGGLAVGGAAAYGVHEAVTFEKAMADVRKKVTLDQGKSFADVEATINKAARTYGMAREEVAQLTAQAGQSGVAFKDLAGFIDLAVKSAGAWDMTGKDAAQTLAYIGAQTKWTIPQLKEFADDVNYMGDISAAAEKDIAAMSNRMLDAAKYSGFRPKETMTALTALRSVGMEPDVAGRFFGQFGSRLRTATSQDKKAKAAYRALGFTPEGLEKGMKTDAMGTTMKFLDALGRSKDPTKYSLDTMGKEWFDEQLKFVGALKELTRIWQEMTSGKARGSLDAAKKIDMDTTANHLERFKALTSEVGDRATRRFLPPVNNVIEELLSRYDRGANLLTGRGESTASVFERMRGMHATGLDRAKAMGFSPALSFQSSFAGTRGTGWAGGDAAGSVAPGALAFGLGKSGVGDIASLQVAPHNPAAVARATLAESAAALRTAPPQPVKLEGAANIDLKVVVEAATDFLAKVEQAIAARGNLRADTGVSMAP